MPFPQIDPVIHLGPLSVHWYGVMYLVGFVLAWLLGRRRARRPHSGWEPGEIDDLVLYAGVGVVVGGRLGYVLFYGLDQAIANPLWIIRIDQGGMSFHGGLLGVLVAMALFARKTERHFLQVADFVAPLAPLGLGAGRLGNFINGELWGKTTDLPWGIVFPTGGPLPRHPSMLYEALLEGLVLFIVVWAYSARRRPLGAVSGLFLLGYGTFRFLVEFVRVPDANLGYLWLDWVTMGQILSLPMMLAGLALLVWAYRHNPTPAEGQDGRGKAESAEDDGPGANARVSDAETDTITGSDTTGSDTTGSDTAGSGTAGGSTGDDPEGDRSNAGRRTTSRFRGRLDRRGSRPGSGFIEPRA
ncbi:MAG: prolipoprotein diacylglyceryl transferase [Actinomycetales bacterium]